MIDPSIPLQSQVAPIGNMLLQGYQAGSQMRQQRDEQPIRNQLMQTQLAGAKQQQQAGAQRQLNDEQKSLMMGSAELKQLIDANDEAGTRAALMRRSEAAKVLGLPSTHSDEGLQLLDQGGLQALKQPVEALFQAGIRSGVLQQPDTGLADYRNRSLDLQERRMDMSAQESAMDRASRERMARDGVGGQIPAGIQEYEYRKRLSPEEQRAFDATKRGDRVTAGTESSILKTADASEQHRINAVNYGDLATRYEQTSMSGGAPASAAEWMKSATGNQDEFTSLRKNWAAIKASQVVSNLPPGAASDADVKLALGGFLPDNAQPKQVAAFLRGVAKLEDMKANYESFKSDYMSENRSTVGLNKAWKVYAKQQGLGGPTTSSANQQAPSAIDDLVNKYAD